MSITFARGDWFDVEIGDPLRYDLSESMSLPWNWEAMSDDEKFSWSERNQEKGQLRCLLYTGSEASGPFLVGEIVDTDVLKEIKDAGAHGNRVIILMRQPYVYNSVIKQNGCMVKVLTGGWAEQHLRRQRRAKALKDMALVAGVLAVILAGTYLTTLLG